MTAFSGTKQFFWRATSAVLRRSGQLLSSLGTDAYFRSLPKLSPLEATTIQRNSIFHNKHKGERCFVIGNGPSIKQQDLDPLRDETTFVVNGFWKHPWVRESQPTYYFICDPIFFDGSPEAGKFFQDLREHIVDSHFFVPSSSLTTVVEGKLLPPESTSYIAYNGRLLGENPDDEFDLTAPVPSVQTVPQLAMLAAIYMGFSQVYLLGLDHDWLARLQPGGYNFFEGLTINHPHALVHRGAYDAEMASMLKVWNGYHALNAKAKQFGTEIFNATHGGFLDVFPRVSYETVVKQGRHKDFSVQPLCSL